MVEYELSQPSVRREWHLSRDGRVAAVLRVPVFRRGGRADVGGEPWRIDESGRVRPDYLVRDERSGREIARFAAASGSEDVRVALRSRLLRSSGTIAVSDSLSDPEATAMALLGAYSAIRGADRVAAAASVPGATGSV
jgi:hypothetical protein